jgi:predicted GNAT family N-acyltransferase
VIKEVSKNDLKQALDLVNNVFSEFVAVDYSEQGNCTFQNYLETKYDEVSADMQTGSKKLWGHYQDSKIIGVIATRDISHIALMFVDKQYHRKGIARQLFDTVLAELKNKADITHITVNSSPYAAKVYERLGFKKTDEQQEKDGIIYVPMAYSLGNEGTMLPFGDSEMDIITVSAAFHHFEEPQRFADECHRVLSAGGTLYVGEFYYPPIIRILFNPFLPFLNAGDVKLYSEKELSGFFLKAELKTLELRRAGKCLVFSFKKFG